MSSLPTDAAESEHRTGPARILVIEDEAVFARAVCRHLERAGHECVIAAALAEGEAELAAHSPDLILLDVRLPDGSGLDFLSRLRSERQLQTPVVVMTAFGEVEDAVAAMKLSAADYLRKPVDLDELLITVNRVLDNQRVSRQLEYSRAREASSSEGPEPLGRSAAMRELKAQIDRIAAIVRAAAGPPPTVLLIGETGSGKDVAARQLHQVSPRRQRPFVHVDCAALPQDLFEAELFGHVRGAFTSAHAARTGLIEAAEDGTVFFDEVGEVPLELQSKLLAVLERRSLRRVGSSQEVRTPAWFVAATNRDVEEMVREGRLRADLYYRLNVLTVTIPPLRARDGDAVLLAEHFGAVTARRYAAPAFVLTEDGRRAIEAYDWPGNVRELKHVIERAVLLSGGAPVTAATLMLPARASGPSAAAPMAEPLDAMTLEQAERYLIERALERCAGNVSEAARQLGVTRMAVRYRMRKYALR